MDKRRGRPAKSPVKVKNKDVLLLARVLYTMQDVSSMEHLRLWQQDRLWNITQKITGMPGGHGESSGLEKHFSEIAEMEEQYTEACAEYVRELKRAEEILNSIESRTMRSFVLARYVLGMQNSKIMAQLSIRNDRFDYLCRLIENAPDMEKAATAWKEYGENYTKELNESKIM